MAFLLTFSLIQREAREHLGLNEGPKTIVERHPEILLFDPETGDIPTTCYLEIRPENLDSVMNWTPGRHRRLHEIYVNRAKQKSN